MALHGQESLFLSNDLSRRKYMTGSFPNCFLLSLYNLSKYRQEVENRSYKTWQADVSEWIKKSCQDSQR